MKKTFFHSILGVLLFVLLSLTNVVAQTTSTQTTSSVVKFRIYLRSNVSVEMGATVISKPGFPAYRSSSVLVLNGTGQTGKTFNALAQSVLASDANVSKMVLLDYPGHGNSGFPVGNVKFGDLTMDDYVTALLASLEQLEYRHIKVNALLGHSLGAEIIQMAQTRLVNRGDSLRRQFGIKSAVFIVPDIASPLQWVAIDAGAADPLAANFVRTDPTLGSIFDLLTTPGGPDTWVGLFYGNLTGAIVPGAPTPAQAIANGFISFDSGAMVKQLIGLPDTPGGPRKPRPTINANTFSRSKGTIAGVVALEQDGLYVFPDEHRAVYRFVTGDQTDNLFFTFTGSNTVHNIHTITPSIYNGVIKRVLSTASQDDYRTYNNNNDSGDNNNVDVDAGKDEN